MCRPCAEHVMRCGAGAEYQGNLEKLKQFFLNGPGALAAAVVITAAAYGLGLVLAPLWNKF